MKKIELKKKIRKIILKQFKINKDKNIKKLSANNVEKWDSLGHLLLISNIEKKLNIKFKDSDIPEILDENKILKEVLRIKK